MCQTKVKTSDLPIYNIFVPHKVLLSKISDYVIACGLPPPPKLKILAMPMAQHARIRYCRKRQQFFGPPERNFAPLEQRSSCGTEEAMMYLTALLPPTWAKSLTKSNLKMQNFKCAFYFNCIDTVCSVPVQVYVKGGLDNLVFSSGFKMLKI